MAQTGPCPFLHLLSITCLSSGRSRANPHSCRIPFLPHSLLGDAQSRRLSGIDPAGASPDLKPYSPACAGAQTEPDPAHGTLPGRGDQGSCRGAWRPLPDAHANVDLRAPPSGEIRIVRGSTGLRTPTCWDRQGDIRRSVRRSASAVSKNNTGARPSLGHAPGRFRFLRERR